ncbi:MAG TPA: squalene/phytoene synthase family protein [Micrococcaceae bacterium]
MPSSRELYDEVASAAASVVIRRYSTSFGLASRLLAPEVRQHVENIYAMVRIADEVVDGAAASARVDTQGVALQLAKLEAECGHAVYCGYSTNLVVHAFAGTARDSGFGMELIEPFFASMRSDIEPVALTPDSFAEYIYGSAEVVGLMCLRAFLRDQPDAQSQYARLEDGARRLGAAFQKINFLRDMAVDFQDLDRRYFPGVDPAALSDAQKNSLLADIDADLAVSAAAIALLPANSRRAVGLAHALFAELSARAARTPASDLMRRRIRVPTLVKLRLAARALLGRPALPRRAAAAVEAR